MLGFDRLRNGDDAGLAEHPRQRHRRRIDAVFRRKLAEYKISEDLVGRTLLNQAAILRFIDMRFRPAVAVSDGEVEIYYRDQFVPQFEKENSGKAAPDIEDVREKLEQIIAAERVDRALDQWLIEARKQARVRYFEEAFQ